MTSTLLHNITICVKNWEKKKKKWILLDHTPAGGYECISTLAYEGLQMYKPYQVRNSTLVGWKKGNLRGQVALSHAHCSQSKQRKTTHSHQPWVATLWPPESMSKYRHQALSWMLVLGGGFEGGQREQWNNLAWEYWYLLIYLSNPWSLHNY